MMGLKCFITGCVDLQRHPPFASHFQPFGPEKSGIPSQRLSLCAEGFYTRNFIFTISLCFLLCVTCGRM